MKEKILFEFKKLYSQQPRIFKAPGRVNLIGEHTDYNEGFVFPMAIDRYTYVAISKRDDRTLNIFSDSYKENITINLEGAKPIKHWSDYVVGVASVFMEMGYQVSGADIFIYSDVPLGAGLSSSAAIEVSTAYALMKTNGLEIDTLNLAKICQKAENDFVGMKCGIMDQFVSIHGKENCALFLDCRSLNYEPVTLDSTKADIIVCNTMVKHELGSTEYNKRRNECEFGVKVIKEKFSEVNSLRDANMAYLNAVKNSIDNVIYKRCKHVITENERTMLSVSALKNKDYRLFGELLKGSHYSLKDDYEVSCTELDEMVRIAESMDFVYGSRLTGGGFGGCTVNLIQHGKQDEFSEIIKREYHNLTGIYPDVYYFKPSGGVCEI